MNGQALAAAIPRRTVRRVVEILCIADLSL
jgi:hypothetical protein